jgi:hypothetical protein
MIRRHERSAGRGRVQRAWAAVVLLAVASHGLAQTCTKYVSEGGSGREASLERPARDLGNIVANLVPGDVVCIAGGRYTGRADSGADRIEVPVEIYGGYGPDFAARDPWGAHVTLFTGIHNAANFSSDVRLTIDTSAFATRLLAARGQDTVHTVVVDGIVIDHGDRNYYAGDDESRIIRLGSAAHTPTPEAGGLAIRTGITSTIVVRNVVVVNTAPTQGAIALFPGAGAQVTVENNVAVNNTGTGFLLSSAIAANDAADYPVYRFAGNVSVFNQKHDPFGTFGGSGVAIESGTRVEITGSVIAFNDNYGVDNAKRAPGVVLTANVIVANARADYLEFDTKIALEDVEDWSDLIADGRGNVRRELDFALSPAWGARYAARNVIDRNAAEEEVRAVDAWTNDVRSFFGWNLVGTDLSVDSDVWLPRMGLADAFAVARRFDDRYGVVWP